MRMRSIGVRVIDIEMSHGDVGSMFSYCFIKRHLNRSCVNNGYRFYAGSLRVTSGLF